MLEFLRVFRKDKLHSGSSAEPTNREAFLESLRKVDKLHEEQIKAAEFKPGELLPFEEEFTRQNGLNKLNYIPQRVLQKQEEAFSLAAKNRDPNSVFSAVRDGDIDRVRELLAESPVWQRLATRMVGGS